MIYWIFLLVAVGRVQELVPGLHELPLAKMTIGLGLLIVLTHWRQLGRLSPVTMPLVRTAAGLAILAVLTAPISIWPGESVRFLTTDAVVLGAAFTVCCKLSYSWRVVRQVLGALATCAFVLGVSAIVRFHGGRAQTGTTYDPNDLAFLLVSVLPITLGFTLTARTVFMRALNMGVLVAAAVALLLTSSRGAFLGLLASMGVLVLLPIRSDGARSQRGKRVRHALGALVAVTFAFVVVWPQLPAETRDRLETVFSLKQDQDYNLDESNREARASIWTRNLYAALQRPIGYGVGSFELVDARTGGVYMMPHNGYLQMFVELGIIGVLLYLRIYALSWRLLQKARRALLAAPADRERDELLVFARMLQVSLIASAVSGFFLSTAYSTLLWLLFATVIACANVIARAPNVVLEAPEPPLRGRARGRRGARGAGTAGGGLRGKRPRPIASPATRDRSPESS